MTRTTTDHDEIRTWAEERGAVPAAVGGTGDEVHWDAFFRAFEDRRLAFLYQEETKDGELSRFNKFISRDEAS